MKKHPIIIKKANEHNLQQVDLTLNTNELIVFTGVSGSGKSSLAFDTLFVEGQRRYIESLSTFARRYIGDMSKPDVELVLGLSPTIAIEQKSAGKNPRSTVGTLTEIYDYLRVLYARLGTPYCPISKEPVTPQSKERIIKKIQALPKNTKLIFLAPFAKSKKGEFKEDFQFLLRKGYTRVRLNGEFVDLSDTIALDKNQAHNIDLVIDRLKVSEENHSRIAEAVMAALEMGKGVLSLLEGEKETLFSIHAFSPKSGEYYTSLEPHDFSFNSPTGMCSTCNGLGITQDFDLDLIIDPENTIAEDCCSLASSYQTVRYGNIYDNLSQLFRFSVHTPWKNLSKKAQEVFLRGTDKKWTQMHFSHPTRPTSWTEYVQWRGVLYEAKERYTKAKSDSFKKRMERLMREQICPSCHGARLRAYPAATRFQDKAIHELTSLTIQEALGFFSTLKLDPTEKLIGEELIKEITQRLTFLDNVGLHYLTLARTAPTLSGGEAQRVRLASQVGCGLVGVTYILDEPSIGLHPRDNIQLIKTLKRLRDMGNTVIVVEHDEETIWAADRIVDFGPGPGRAGGEIVVNGSHQKLLSTPRSITGSYLNGTRKIEIPETRREPIPEQLELKGASHHNLKNVNVTIPLGIFIAVTGVSGSGKSSLITDTLFPILANHLHKAEHSVGAHKKMLGLEHIDKVIEIDQSPIGRNPRSNPATYVKIFDEIRNLFCQLPESVARGYQPGRFSFNVQEGSCVHCQGVGLVKVDMDFLEDQWVMCTICKGKRFNPETLSIYYKGKNIYDVLEMTAQEALEFFHAIPPLKRKLEVVCKVGLEYLTLGQPSPTLSGGEAQRIKLAKELVRPPSGRTLYILDEPTTGLHFHDIKALLKVLHTLVDRGNTLLVIEHNMDVVKTADWIIDIGPEGGYQGGKIVATGTPEKIAKLDTPTGQAIHHALYPPPHPTKQLTPSKVKPITAITLKGATQNNLKHLDLSIQRGATTICTGPSGSGKSSLAFDTIYAEGQRRYIESLSPYARQFVQQMPKPHLTQIEGLAPAIAIEQKAAAGNPRSTVGTMTEVYDYLRLLFAHLGTAYCPQTHEPIKSITPEYVVNQLLKLPKGDKLTICAPLALDKGDKFEELTSKLQREGYLRLRLNDTIYELDEPIPFDKRKKNTLSLIIDRLKISPQIESRLFEAVENAAHIGNDTLLALHNDKEIFYNLAFAVESTGKSYPKINPHTFSFNSPEGMCPDCQGLGYQYGANFITSPDILNLSLSTILSWLWSPYHPQLIQTLFKPLGIDPKTPLKALSKEQLRLLIQGDKWITISPKLQLRWRGIQESLAMAAKNAHSQIKKALLPLLNEIDCPSCHGTRLNPLARHVKLKTHTLGSLCQLPISEALPFLETLKLDKKQVLLLDEVLTQLKGRLSFLNEVGLNYISLDRRAPTLSNGEAQRIRLARQLGNQLTGVLYVLDEPTVGLHPQDNHRLNQALAKLKALGNTLLLVEHDPLTVATADYILDFGPGAGTHGGHLMAQGTYSQILKNPQSLTGRYLSHKKTIPIPPKRRVPTTTFPIKNATLHNLKDISFDLPLGILTGLTGLSGSGKSTLMHDVIKPLFTARLQILDPFEKLIVVDQNPIGHTTRSDVSTYVDLLTPLREFFASLAASRTKGLLPRHFSYNHRKGMCTHCWGLGYRKVEMLFLAPVKVTCEQCQGLRLNPLSLTVEYQSQNFGQLLKTTIQEVRHTFEFISKVRRICDTLISVGLGYLQLGQAIGTLSGGEAQRIKLSRDLAKRTNSRTLYLLDEPTTGLHPEDIQKLLLLLHKLVDKGNTMIIIEHNLDLIKNCDYVIDLGPEGGKDGGEIICQGTPEEVANHATSYTGAFLKQVLNSA